MTLPANNEGSPQSQSREHLVAGASSHESSLGTTSRTKLAVAITTLVLGVIALVSGILVLALVAPGAVPLSYMLVVGVSALSLGVALLTLSVMVACCSKLSAHFDGKKGSAAELLKKIEDLEESNHALTEAVTLAKEEEAVLQKELQDQEQYMAHLWENIGANRELANRVRDLVSGVMAKNKKLQQKLTAVQGLLASAEENATGRIESLLQENEQLSSEVQALKNECHMKTLAAIQLKNQEYELKQKLLQEKDRKLQQTSRDATLKALGQQIKELLEENLALREQVNLSDLSSLSKELARAPLETPYAHIVLPAAVGGTVPSDTISVSSAEEVSAAIGAEPAGEDRSKKHHDSKEEEEHKEEERAEDSDSGDHS